MKHLLILGAGTAGTMMANRLSKKLAGKDWKLTVVDQYAVHYYQPGFLFIPFDMYKKEDVVKPKREFLPMGIEYIQSRVELIEHGKKQVILEDKRALPYDILIIATGCKIVPGEVEGLTCPEWHKSIYDFYTIEGALALREKLRNWRGGKLVMHMAQMPVKCPVAPLEFLFLADWFFTRKGMRETVEIEYVTPLDSAFTKPNCSNVLGYMLAQKGITLETEFAVERVDAKNRKVISYEEREVDYDLLVSIPTNMGDELMARSELGDDLNFVPTHKHTLQSKKHGDIFVLGDATDLPASKAGSVAHFQAETLARNIERHIKGKPLLEEFDGHANCFIESGFGKAFLIDFNYDMEPVEGTFPVPGIGPFSLLKETRINHWGKLAFRWIYWNILLKGRPMPGVSHRMQRAGKKLAVQP